jgi:tetratricopeptide (TPR) repeat protein
MKKPRHPSLLAVTLVAVIALTLAPFLHSAALSARGKVTGQDGRPLPDVTVTLDDASGQEAATAKTDAEGNYALPGIAPGNCILRFDKEGYRTLQGKVLIASGEKNVFNVTLALESAGPAKPAWEDKNLRARALYDRGEYREALALYKEILAAAPTVAFIRFDAGNCQFHLRDFEEALASYLEAVRLNPEFYEAYTNLARTYAQLKRSAEAIPFFESAIRSHPAGGQLFLPLGLLYLDSGDAAKSIVYLQKAAEFEPKNPAVHNALGRARDLTGDTAGAIVSYEKYAGLISNEKEIARVRGIIEELRLRIKKQAAAPLTKNSVRSA